MIMLEYTDEVIWKDIPDYDGVYQASSHGEIKSFKNGKERILKPNLNNWGYEHVNLCKDGVKKNHYVHRLVMEAHSYVDKGLFINHIDENKRNNHVSNLEYCTRSENISKFHKNNPEFAKESGRKMGKKNGHKYLDTHTGIVYASAREVSFMMFETGQAKSKWTWWSILQKGKPQDRFIRVYI